MSATQQIDLKQIVENWAWREYESTATRSQRNIKRKHDRKGYYIGVQIDWSQVTFNDTTYWPQLAPEIFEVAATGKAHGGGDQNQVNTIAESGKMNTNVLFQTTFCNTTSAVQEYTLKTEKTTRSTMSTEIETCYTKGIDFGIKLCTPGEILEANAGYHREMSLTNVSGETLEEEMSWGVESQIQVKSGHIAEAELVVKEKKYSGEFQIKSHIKGYVYVTFTNLRDNNSLIMMTGHDLADILQLHLDMAANSGRPIGYVKIEGSQIVILTSGTCKFRYGIKQEVKVSERSLNNNKP